MKNFSFRKYQEFFFQFLIQNAFLRRLRGALKNKIFPFFTKTCAAFLALLVIILILIKIFKPAYLEKVQQKSRFYFFHYLNLDNQNFSEIKITGNKRTKVSEIEEIVFAVSRNFKKQELQKTNDKNYEPLIQKLIIEIKRQLPWINQIVINRSMPNSINIFLTEYEPFAIWQDHDKKYVTDKEGNIVLLQDIEEFKHLLILSGKDANKHAKSLFNIFAIDPNLSRRVYSATWLGGRRWDIRFDNNLLVKLPENNISEAWQNLIKIYSMPGSIIGLKVIDLRIEDKIYLEYGDSVIKELKNL